MGESSLHIPVMPDEIINALQLSSGNTILDCTLGLGGHSLRISRVIDSSGTLIGLDRDQDAISIARQTLDDFSGKLYLIHTNYSDLDQALISVEVDKVDGMLLDAGVSSMQLDQIDRGFSFREDGPLDMRMDQSSGLSAQDLVNTLTEQELSRVLKDFGQERWANKIARHIVEYRAENDFTTTRQLAEVVANAIPKRFHEKRIHPATRSFQAIRIAVNEELDSLQQALEKGVLILNSGARMAVISFHSLEDRIVKHAFRRFAKEELGEVITKRPLLPSEEEKQANARSRSAKLRVFERR